MRSVVTVLLLMIGLILLGVGLWASMSPTGLLELFGATSQHWYGGTEYSVDPSVVRGGGIAVAAIGGTLAAIGFIRAVRR